MTELRRSWSETFTSWLPKLPFRGVDKDKEVMFMPNTSTVSAPPAFNHPAPPQPRHPAPELHPDPSATSTPREQTKRGGYRFRSELDKMSSAKWERTLMPEQYCSGKQMVAHRQKKASPVDSQTDSDSEVDDVYVPSRIGEGDASRRIHKPVKTRVKARRLPKPTTKCLYSGDNCRSEDSSDQDEKRGRQGRSQNHRRLKDPKPFNATSIEWSDYLKHFETVADWNGWTLAEMATQLVMCFDGEAIKLLGELSSEMLGDYRLLVQELNRRYDPRERAQAFKLEFRSRFRKPTESITQYAQSLNRLVSKAFPNMPSNAQQQWVLDQFTLGLGSVDLQRHVQFGHPKELNEAISLAIEYEAFEAGVKHRKPYQKPSEVFSISPVADQTSKSAIPAKGNKSQNPAQRNSAYPSEPRNNRLNTDIRSCHYCKQVGHLIKDCVALKSRQQTELRNMESQGNQFRDYSNQRQWQQSQPNSGYSHYPQYQPPPSVNAPFQAAPFYPQNQGN